MQQKIHERQRQSERMVDIGLGKLALMLYYWHLRKATPQDLDREDGWVS